MRRLFRQIWISHISLEIFIIKLFLYAIWEYCFKGYSSYNLLITPDDETRQFSCRLYVDNWVGLPERDLVAEQSISSALERAQVVPTLLPVHQAH